MDPGLNVMMQHPSIESARSIQRRRFIQVSAGSLAYVATGCDRRKESVESRPSRVIVGVPGEESLQLDAQQVWVTSLPLMALNENGEYEGRLAERWEHSPDFREWTYYLRRGVRWHDGHPVTAHDIKFWLELLCSPDVLEFAPGSFEAIDVLNDYTVRVRQRGRMANDYRWEYPQFPRHLLEHLDTKQFWDWDFWKHPVGAGPYRFARYQPQTMMEFEANPDFYSEKPRIARVVAKFVGQGGLADLLAGNVDAITRVDPAWIPTLRADPRFRLYHSTDYPQFATIAWQHRDPLFRDVRVRRAMTLAINRRELAQLQHFPEDAPLADGPVTRRQLQRGELEQPLPYDPAQARALLDAAGWREQSGSAVRQREGLAFRFIVLATDQQTAVYVREQLRRVGVDMTLQIHDIRQIREKVNTANFQAAIVSDSALYNRWGLNDANFSRTRGLGYWNARVVELVNRSNVTADPAEMDRIFAELGGIFREDVPATYLTPFMRASVAHRRIRGLSSPWRTHPFRLMDELSLDGGA